MYGVYYAYEIRVIFIGEIPDNLTANDEYTPITLVDVERSFSVYKNLLGNNRCSMFI